MKYLQIVVFDKNDEPVLATDNNIILPGWLDDTKVQWLDDFLRQVGVLTDLQELCITEDVES